MVGMEVNAGEPFDTKNQTVTQLITWLGLQNPDSHVVLEDGGTIKFYRQRLSHGGQIEVRVEHHRDDEDERQESDEERALREAEVSKTDSPQDAERIVAAAHGDEDLNRPDEDSELLEADEFLPNEGEDQGGEVPGTSQTPSDRTEET